MLLGAGMLCFDPACMLYAQEISLTFNLLPLGKGLPNSENYFISQDTFGFIWIGTDEGLYRFDGLNLKHIPLEQPGSAALRVSEKVTSRCFEDRSKNLWFSTASAILCYHQNTGSLNIYPGSTRYNMCAFHLDIDGKLWLKADSNGQSALYHLDTRVRRPKYDHRFPLKGERFAVVTHPKKGQVMKVMATMLPEEPGLIVTDVNTGQSCAVEIMRPNGKPFNDKHHTKNAWIDGDSVAWVGVYNGIAKYNLKTGKAVAIVEQQEIGWIDGVVPYDDNRLLVASESFGLLMFDKDSEQFGQQFRFRPGVPGALPQDCVKNLYRDASGNIWLSGPGMGIAFAHLRKSKFSYPPETVGIPVSALFKDGKNRIWCGSRDSGVYVFAQDSRLQWRTTVLNNHDNPTQYSSLPEISSFWEDQYQSIWGLYENNALPLNAARRQFEFWEKNFFGPHNTSSDLLRANCQLTDGTQLIARGRNIFQLKTAGKTARLLPWIDLNFLGLQQVTAIFQSQSNKGYLYLADNPNRILILALDTIGKRITKIKELPDTGNCTAFSETPDGHIWATGSKGLFRIDADTTGRLLTEKKDGIPNERYYSVLPDDSGCLWLTGPNGLMRYDPADRLEKRFHRFETADGLLSLTFSPNTILLRSNGNFWVGGKNGVNVFRPEDIRFVPTLPKIQITKIKVNDMDRIADPYARECDTLEFSHLESTLTFEFVALEYSNPASNRMKYRLSGYDREWLEIPSGVPGSIRYAGLDPGNYTFQIMAANSDGVWTTEPKSLSIVIHPPFWQRLWFKILMGLLFALAVWGAVRLYIRRQLSKQRILLEKQEALQAERNRIAGELHDDIGQGLSKIKAISEAAKQWTIAEDNRRQLDKIWISSMELIEKMGDIIWAVDGGNDTLENLLHAIRAYTGETLETHRIAATLQLPETIPDFEMSGARRRNILLLVKECLHNIVKHSGATAADIHIAVNKSLTIQIRDNGHGFVEKAPGPGGHGLRNMEKRARAAGGDLKINNSARGVTVLFVLPLSEKQ